MGKISIWFHNNIGGSTEARFGFSGMLIGFILFAPSLIIYFLQEGDTLVLSTGWNAFIGYALLGLWALAWILAIIFAIVWWKNRLQDDTPKILKAIEARLGNIENILNTINTNTSKPMMGGQSNQQRNTRNIKADKRKK